MAERPLDELDIIVTRPREQAAGLIQRLQALGARPHLLPLLEILPASDQAALQVFAQQVVIYQLLIFISPNAVRYGMAALRHIPPGVRVAAVGQGSAQALRALGVTDIIVPAARQDSEGLLDEPALQQVAGWHIAIVRGDGGRELLGDTLRARGARVDYITSYQRSTPALDAAAWRAIGPDVILVTSSEALAHLWHGLGAAASALAAQTTLLVIHPRIAQAAQAQGWRSVVIAPGGDDGICDGLVAWAAQHRK
ncbi:MAG: uroporphyrinogen-III synthase [Pseudomonadota bacterium]